MSAWGRGREGVDGEKEEMRYMDVKVRFGRGGKGEEEGEREGRKGMRRKRRLELVDLKRRWWRDGT